MIGCLQELREEDCALRRQEEVEGLQVTTILPLHESRGGSTAWHDVLACHSPASSLDDSGR